MNNKQTEIIQYVKNELPELAAIIGLSAPKGSDIQTLALQELEYLQFIGLTKPEIYECEPITVKMAIKKVLKQNLTLDPDQGLTYVKTRTFKTKNEQGVEVSKKALEITPSAGGLISINRQLGRVVHVERPEVKKNEMGKVLSVSVRYLVPSFNETGKRIYIWQTAEFDETDFMRWRIASHKENGRYKQDADIQKLNYANANYTSHRSGIDPEFAKSKAIKHTLNPRRLGTNSNETNTSLVVVSAPVNLDIDQEKDESAMNDEYINHEDVQNEGTTNASNNANNGNGVHVTMHDEMDIPKSSDL